MPYRIRKAPKRDLYWVIGEDGKHHSKDPIPKERALAQMRALYRAERMKGGMDRGLALEPCEGEAHTGETTLSADEVHTLKSLLEDDDADRKTISNIYRVLRLTLSNPLDLNVMNEVRSFLVSGATDRRRTNDAINKLLIVLNRVFPRSSGGMKGGIIDRATFEMRKVRMPGYYPADLTYEDFARAEGANEEFIRSEQEKLRKQNEAYYAAVSRGEIEEDVACKLDANLEYNRDVVPKSVCAQRHEERRKKDMTPTQRVFDDINKGLSKVADWSVENVLGNLPVVGQVVGSTYKEFAPPTSKFYKPMGEKGVAERIADAGIDVAEIQKKKREKKNEKKAEGAGVSASGRGAIRRKFKDEIKRFGLSPASYLARARAAAKADGYDPKSLTFSDDDTTKLMITDDSGRKVRFGRVGYGDFLLWSAAEKKGKVKNGFAAQKRDTFQKSHSQIKGDWKSNKYSPNSLALAILW